MSKTIDQKEKERLEAVHSYHILDTPPDPELDDIVKIASLMVGTPISLVSFTDENRQWFKARVGVNINELERTDALCAYALDNVKDELLIIDDPQGDDRFKDNPLVAGEPNIRFYLGAPLCAAGGEVLGTLCVIDDKPRTISEDHKEALRLLAAKVMNILNARKEMIQKDSQLALSAERLEKISDSAPGAVFEMLMGKDGSLRFTFMSKGMAELHPDLDLEKIKLDAAEALKTVHPDDLKMVIDKLSESKAKMILWNADFRVAHGDGLWHRVVARPVQKIDGEVVWYGTFQDITAIKNYLTALEESFFDLSHIMRRPIANLSGITNLISKEDIGPDERKALIENLLKTSQELEQCSADLNKRYADIDQNFKNSN